jgi:hypothetical protein
VKPQPFQRLADALDALAGISRQPKAVSAVELFQRLSNGLSHMRTSSRHGLHAPAGTWLIFPQENPGEVWIMSDVELAAFERMTEERQAEAEGRSKAR